MNESTSGEKVVFVGGRSALAWANQQVATAAMAETAAAATMAETAVAAEAETVVTATTAVTA